MIRYFIALCLVSFLGPAVSAPTQVWIPGWKSAAHLVVPRAGAATVNIAKNIYLIGGIDGREFLSSTEYSTQNDDGSLSTWQPAASLVEPRGFVAAVSANRHVYAIGGGNGPNGHNLLNSVERATVNSDGTLGPWQREKFSLNLPRRCAKAVVLRNRIYVLGGFSGTLLDSVESAEILENGDLGQWRIEKQKLALPRYVHSVKKLNNDAIIVLGGHQESQGAGVTEVEMSSLNDQGELDPWRIIGTTATGRFGLEVLIHNSNVYAFGGLDGVTYMRSAERAPLLDDAPLEFQTTNPLATRRANFGLISVGDWVYAIGGTNQEGYFDSVEYAQFNAYGDLGYWGTKEEAHAYERGELEQTGRARLAVSLPRQGTVIEHVPAGQYSYLKLSTPQGEEWIAVGSADFTKDEPLAYSEGIVIENFKSQSLDRTFDTIRFVSRVERFDLQQERGVPH